MLWGEDMWWIAIIGVLLIVLLLSNSDDYGDKP